MSLITLDTFPAYNVCVNNNSFNLCKSSNSNKFNFLAKGGGLVWYFAL